MIEIALGIGVSALDFLIAMLFIKKAISKAWDLFYKSLVYSMLTRLIFVLLAVLAIIKFTDFRILNFLVSLFVCIFVFKLIEIFYIHYKIKRVNLQKQ